MPFDPEDPRLTAYALGELDDGEIAEIESLLAESPEGPRLLEEIRETARLLAASLAGESAPGLTPAHHQAIEGGMTLPAVDGFAPPARPWQQWAGYGMAASLLAGFGLSATWLVFGHHGRTSPHVAVIRSSGSGEAPAPTTEEWQYRWSMRSDLLAAKQPADKDRLGWSEGFRPDEAAGRKQSDRAGKDTDFVERESLTGLGDSATGLNRPAKPADGSLRARHRAPDLAPAAPAQTAGAANAQRGLGRTMTEAAKASKDGHFVQPDNSAYYAKMAPAEQKGVPGGMALPYGTTNTTRMAGGMGEMGAGMGGLSADGRTALSQRLPQGPQTAPTGRARGYADNAPMGRPAGTMDGTVRLFERGGSGSPNAGLALEDKLSKRNMSDPATPRDNLDQRLATARRKMAGKPASGPEVGQAEAKDKVALAEISRMAGDEKRKELVDHESRLRLGVASEPQAKPAAKYASKKESEVLAKLADEPAAPAPAPAAAAPAPAADAPAVPAPAAVVADPKAAFDAMAVVEEAPGTEAYNSVEDNKFEASAAAPLSTFSIDVDTASYANIRRFLMAENRMPPKAAVRIEEMVNYFPYRYDAPTLDRADAPPFSVNVEIARCPWNAENRLARIGLKGKVDAKDRVSNLVFLIDVSGSMDQPNKLPLVQASMRMLANQLGENDRVSIVVYAGAAGLVLDSTSGIHKYEIAKAIDELRAGGSTAGGAGIELAYRIAQKNFVKGGVNRVILATDGDFNVGVSDDKALEAIIAEKAKGGVFLSVLAFGTGNVKDAKMEGLADKGNGNYAYIDSLQEAKKVLVDQMVGTLVTIAKDVKIQVDFNPAKVGAYRLIGYENRMLAAADFDNDAKDAGEIGAGHTVTAFYELAPPAKAGEPAEEQVSKYVQVKAGDPNSAEMFTVKIRYKAPDGDKSTKLERPISAPGGDFSAASEDFKFASSVAAFGMILRGSPYKGTATFGGLLEWAESSKGTDPDGYRKEFCEMVRKAQVLTAPGPK